MRQKIPTDLVTVVQEEEAEKKKQQQLHKRNRDMTK